MNDTAMLAIDGRTMRLIRERCDVLAAERGKRVPFAQYVRELVAADATDVAATTPTTSEATPCHQ